MAFNPRPRIQLGARDAFASAERSTSDSVASTVSRALSCEATSLNASISRPLSMKSRLITTFCLCSRSSIDWRAKSSIGARLLRSTCNAGSSPNRFGSANSNPISTTSATSTYFQRGNSSMSLQTLRADWSVAEPKGSGALERALGHELRDLRLLHLNAHAVGDLQRDEGIVDLDDASQDAAGGNDLIAGSQAREHRLLLLHALLLRPDQQEIEHSHEHDQDDDLTHAAAPQAPAGGLRVRVTDQ